MNPKKTLEEEREKQNLIKRMDFFDDIDNYSNGLKLKAEMKRSEIEYRPHYNGTSSVVHIPTGISIIFPVDKHTKISYVLYNFHRLKDKIKPTDRFI